MGIGFVVDSFKTFIAEVPMLLTHHMSAGDKPDPSQLLQGLKQPAEVLPHNKRQGAKPRHLGRERKNIMKEKSTTVLHKANLHPILLNVTFEGNKILLLRSFNPDQKEESEIWG